MSSWDIKKLKPTVRKINSYRDEMHGLSDEQILDYSKELKKRAETERLDKLLPEAYALVREATRRALGKEHYDVQLMAGIVLFEGKIAEAKTGEGKTITIYLPAYLAALEGKGVYVVTVNDYLANRDATDAKKVFEMLGMSVGCVLNQDLKPSRQAAYRSDVTYVTNSELGFDYLKDHLVYDINETVLRGFNYAIIDEVDSILIDEAKTPLIISGAGEESGEFLRSIDKIVKRLKKGKLTEASKVDMLVGGSDVESGDFIKQEKENMIYLTEKGIKRIENMLNIENYGSPENLLVQRAVNNALRANYMMKKDKDYIVREGKVEIVDTFTGRVLPGRRFSDGLHQAIEAKERVEVQKENVTVATVTFQSFFNKFDKKAGLTGTAATSAKEFKNVYDLEVVEIPTNKPVIRKDLTDCVFSTKKEKWAAVLEAVKSAHAVGQPVLVGTVSIEDSETISDILKKNAIECNVLNAKNEALEAEIIAGAGKFGAVTVATNMAGRGTDIVLDEKSREAGGLLVIGTERHDSRRIDNQLKGRSGRQGDPGVSQFYISLEDKVMRVFAEQSSLQMLMAMARPGQPIQFKQLAKIIEKAQEAVENENRLTRENLLKYDETNNEHREEIYAQREELLATDNAEEILLSLFNSVSNDIINRHIDDNTPPEQWDLRAVIDDYCKEVIDVNFELDPTGMTKQNLIDAFTQVNQTIINAKNEGIEEDYIRNSFERSVMLRIMDRQWIRFMSIMEYVQQNIGSQSYGEKDPAIEYKKRGVIFFNQMIEDIAKDSVRQFMLCQLQISDA